jgi:hypothetical protein
MKNKILIFVIVLSLVLSLSAFAANSVNISIGEELVEFNKEYGSPFIDENNRTQVPFRVTMEKFGAVVDWNNDTRRAIAEKEGIVVEVPIGEDYIIKNGEIIKNDTSALIKDGRTYLPIRAVLESFGADVGWNNDTRTVLVDKNPTSNNIFKGYTLIEVDGGDLSGHREANVVVDIGYGDREYWAFTNEYEQLVKVVADEIILQDEENEDVLDSGRYYYDEAKVPGTESSKLDEGHIIADSLGGVANAYNITPQESTLNRHGDQAYMEDWIREAGGCKDFTAIITYPDTETQIPSHYSYTYNLMGDVIEDSFDNINPDEVNSEIIEEESDLEDETEAQEEKAGQVEIVALDKRAEYVTIENVGKTSIDISGWIIISVKGQQRFTFPDGYVLETGQQCKLTSGDLKDTGDFTMANTTIWNNSSKDPAELYNDRGELVDRFE